MYVSSCYDVVVSNVCGRVGLALGQACFLQCSSGRIVLVWQASAASGSFRCWTLHFAGRCRCRRRLFVRLDLSIRWLAKRYTSLALSGHLCAGHHYQHPSAPTPFTGYETKQTTYSLSHHHFRYCTHLMQRPKHNIPATSF